MKFSYADLIAGDSIPVNGVGHFKSPKLWQLMPTKGIGTWVYNFYLNILSWDKEDVLKFISGIGMSTKALETREELTTFDIIVLVGNLKELLREAMAFFMDENLEWDEASYTFIAYSREETQKAVGYINRDNFDDVKDMMLQVNYIGIGDQAKPTKFSSAKAKELWELAQKHLKETKHPKDKRMELGNIISKLCAVNCGYTLLNIYDLTVFQLYDQFFQYGYMRAMDLNERAFTIHGGKNFSFETWLEPILKI